VLALCLGASASAFAQALDAARVKAVLVARCLEYVGWPDSADSKELRIGLLGVDAAASRAFEEMVGGVSVAGRKVRILRLSGARNLRRVHVLYAGASLAAEGPAIWKAIERKKVFLVTDGFPDRKYVMLNLVADPSRSRIKFEVNRANALVEGFAVSPELLLLGGTEIDVRAVYRDLRDDMGRMEDELRTRQARLQELAATVDSLDARMARQARSATSMESALAESARRLAGQESLQSRLAREIGEKSGELRRQDRVLDSQRVEIEAKQASIARMRESIAALSADLAGKERQIREGKARIKAQAEALRRLGEQLAGHRHVILLMAAASVLLLALGAAVYVAYSIKRNANANLEAKVRERTAELEEAFLKQRELEASLQQGEKLKSIGRLAGGIAHDFNNQLGGILGFADLLKDRLADRPALRDYAETIITLVGRSKDLTSQLLAFARKGRYRSEPVDVHRLVHEVASLLERTAGRNIVLRQALAPGRPFVLGDPTQLQNALLNLAINARDAMPGGGELLLSTAVEEVPAGRDGSGAGGGRFVLMAVKDGGVGMDNETLKRAFEPFFTTKAAGQGTGMGLAAVFGTVQAHKGFIEVDTEPGAGSEFRIFLPWIPAPEALEGAVPVGHVSAAGARRLRILLVDDDSSIRAFAASQLESMGHEVIACPDAVKALEAFREGPRDYDLVLLDMVMPGMNGKDLFHRMKAVNPDVVAALVSGFCAEEDARDMVAAGVRGILMKPFGRADLASLLADLAVPDPAHPRG
jgi:signal transduction histidine kinase/ActR/RegA family two-component response regulator